MKRIVIVICWLLPLFASAQEKPAIKFSAAKNWNDLLAEAKAANKSIFIDAYATWCAPCKQMDREVFTEKSVADYINANFVAIRVQMDPTNKDSEYVKIWQKEAKRWETYVIGYPCFLFYSPDGTFTGRKDGFHKPEEFLTLLKKESNSENRYDARVQKFKEGILDKKEMFSFALYAKSLKDTIANTIAREYKHKYIDPLPVDSLLNPEANKFTAEFYKIFNSEDKIIVYMNQHPDLSDSLVKRDFDFSRKISDFIISRDYIYDKILPNDEPIKTAPEWKNIHKKIAKAFDKKTADRTTLNAKIFWSHRNEKFNEAAKYEFEKIDKYGMDTTGIARALFNNMIYSIVFKKVDDISLLKKAASLMKYVTDLDNQNISSHFDTYASVLYKAGERKQALEKEYMALKIAQKNKDDDRMKYYTDMIERMKKGEETWKLD